MLLGYSPFVAVLEPRKDPGVSLRGTGGMCREGDRGLLMLFPYRFTADVAS